MKLVITEEDIRRLEGRFIIQVDTDDPIFIDEVKKSALPFYMEKRVSLVASGNNGRGSGKVILCDLYGGTLDYTRKKFVDMFNNYLGDSKGKRFHRLLTQREMDVVNEFMKSRQY